MLSALSVCSVRRITIAASSLCCTLLLTSAGAAQEPPRTEARQPAERGPATVSHSLADVLSHAETHAPLLATAEARVDVAKAGVAAEAPWFPANPELGVGLGSRSSSGNTGFEFEFSLAQELELAGEQGLRRKAARANARVAELGRDAIRWELHVEIHRLFNQLLLMDERRRQAERFVDFSESLQEIAAGQVKAGEEAPLTLLVAQADVAQTKSVLLRVRQQEATTSASLKGLIGWPQSRPLRVDGVLPPTSRAPATAELLKLMAKHHPSLKMRQEAISASQARLRAERRQAWPNPTIGASYGREAGLAGQPSNDVLLFNLSVPFPLWQRNQGGIARALAERDVAASQQAAVRNRLETNLQMTASALDSAAAQVELYENSVVPRLEQNLSSLQKAYELGEVGLMQVSQTRERLLDGTRRYLDARISYFAARAALEGFVGTELPETGREKS